MKTVHLKDVGGKKKGYHENHERRTRETKANKAKQNRVTDR